MRILEVNTEKTWRGGERQTYFALKGFRKLGAEVHLLAREGYPLLKKAFTDGFSCFAVKRHLDIIPFFIRTRGQYDIIHVQTATLLTYAVLTKPLHKTRVVYTRRLDFVPRGGLTRWKYNKADLIVTISTPIRNILEIFGVKKTVLIQECIEKRELDKERAQQFLRDKGLEGKKIVGTTAALVQHKDPQTLVKTIKLLSQLRQDFVLLHFGDGILKGEIEELIKRNQLENYYMLAGFVDNVEDFFSVFDVFVMSSEEEGLGSSVLDAFIYEVPVVSTNAGGLAEIVKDRGTLVSVKDAEALSIAIHSALNEPEANAHLVRNAYNYAQNELNIESIHKKYLKAFENII